MSTLQPPTPRDFEIHRANQIEKASTRQLAEKYKLSQTRIRQIARRVNKFIALTLPENSDLDPEQEARLAKAIAADQLQHQAELLQSLFEGTTDPKYLRHQTRVVLAQARLGVLPGAIDEMMPDQESIDLSSRHTPCAETQTAATSPIQNPKSKIEDPPPPRDCSPQTTIAPEGNFHEHTAFAATTGKATPSAERPVLDEQEIAGLRLMESRLLTLLDNTDPGDGRRESFQRALASVRQNLATVGEITASQITAPKITATENAPPEITVTEIKIAPDFPGLRANSTTTTVGPACDEPDATQNQEHPVTAQ